MSISHAIFAAGCFWGVQSTFDDIAGVISSRVGYIGGNVSNPTYEMVCQDNTGHAEAIEITYNSDIVTYEQLLDIFFSIHNPTTKNRQGWDVGTQYRSAIFYLDDNQKEQALKKIDELNSSDKLKGKIVTEVVKATEFYPAEEYHQKYLQKKGGGKCNSCSSSNLFNPISESKASEINYKDMSETEWKKILTREQYKVLREKGTERPFSGKLLDNKDDGTYVCGACGNPIFTSESKFESGCGWPSFDDAITNSVKLIPDFSHGMNRTEVVCANCGSHLGHLFNDGPTETGERFCINSISMDFEKDK